MSVTDETQRNAADTAVWTQPGAAPDIAGYVLHEVLGRGGMATVWRATHAALERAVAIKVVAATGAGAESYLRRLEHEALGLAKLSHPNIVELYDFGRTRDGAMYYVMPLLPGGDLSRWPKPAPEERVATLLAALLEALAHAHAEEVVHRDIKPANVLFDKADRPKLADFGAALLRRRDRLTAEGMAIGSVGYMSPEQARGAEIDARSDLYSLGVVAYELLTGRAPFDGPDSLAIALAQAESPVPRLPDALAHWQSFFDRALAVAPSARFASAEAMRRAIPAPHAAVPRSSARRWIALALGALVVLSALGALGAARWWSRGAAPPSPATRFAAIAALFETGSLTPPARPNVRDEIAAARARGFDTAALAKLQEQLFARLDADLQAALAGADAAVLAQAWQRWRATVDALGAQRDLVVTAREGAIERRVAAELEAAARALDASAAGAALAIVDAWKPAPPALAALAARVRALPKVGERFHDENGPELALVRAATATEPGIAIATAAVAPALYREFLAARGPTTRDCAAQTPEVQGCIDAADARDFAAWIAERTGARYRLPTREELVASIGVVAPAPARAWTSTCNNVNVATRPNVARRAWTGVRRLFGKSGGASTYTRCAGHFALLLDGKGDDAKALENASAETTVVLVREVPARTAAIE